MEEQVERAELGSGWRFPVRIDEHGGIAVSAYEDKVRESIRLILSTAKGERVMRPDFGCDIHEFAFSELSAANLTMMQSAVREALDRWEPRIAVLEVTPSTDEIASGVLRIGLRYRIRRTNSEANLVYPFYLNPGT